MHNVSDLSLRWNTHRVPLFGSFIGQANVIGTVIFMSAFVTSVPSWVNEKKPHVSVNKSIWSSTLTSNLLKASFGYLAGITYRSSSSSNVLNVISRHAPAGPLGVVTRIAVYLFNFATIIPGIPVISILVRYNLVTAKFCPPWVANMIGVVAPWVVSMFFYHGQGLSIVVNWSAILFQGFINFAVPALLYYFAIKLYPHFPDVVIEHLSDDDCFGPSHLPIEEDKDGVRGDIDGILRARRTDTLLSINDDGAAAAANLQDAATLSIQRNSSHMLSSPRSSIASSDKHPVFSFHPEEGGFSHDHGADGCVIHHTDLNKRFEAIEGEHQQHTGDGSNPDASTLYPALIDAGGEGGVKASMSSEHADLASHSKSSHPSSTLSHHTSSSSSSYKIPSYGATGNLGSSSSSDDEEVHHLDGDLEFAKPGHTPGWFFANQQLKLRPIDALPRPMPNRWKMFTALGLVIAMTALTLTALTLDFYFLAKHQDIVDN